MIVHYITLAGEELHSQPETAAPQLGTGIVLQPPAPVRPWWYWLSPRPAPTPEEGDDPPRAYLVVGVTRYLTPLPPGRAYYSLTDAPRDEVWALVIAKEAIPLDGSRGHDTWNEEDRPW